MLSVVHDVANASQQKETPTDQPLDDSSKRIETEPDDQSKEPSIDKTTENDVDKVKKPSGKRSTQVENKPNRPANGIEHDSGVRILALGDIIVGAVNARREFAEDAMLGLQQSIEADGLWSPVLVAPEPGQPGKWHLLAGERRYRAVVNLGWTTISARVLDLPPNKWRAIMMAENLQREDFSLAEELRGYLSLISEDGYSIAQIVDELKINKGYLYTLLRIQKNRRLRQAIEDGLINGKKVLYPLNRLIAPDGTEISHGLARKALDYIATKRPSVRELEDVISDWLSEVDSIEITSGRMRKHPGSIWEKERQRVQGFIAKSVTTLEPEAVKRLAEIYQQTAEDLRRLIAEDKD